MAKVVDEDGNVNIGRPVATEYSPPLETTDWTRTFVIAPKRSINNAPIRPFSTAYTRVRETFAKGQRLVLIEWMTPGEYVMSILKDEVNV